MSLARLLQLASPTLPVGAYSYSQGLEAAIEAGYVKDAVSAQEWIGDVLELSMARMEAQVLRAQIAAPDPGAQRLLRRYAGDRRAARRDAADGAGIGQALA